MKISRSVNREIRLVLLEPENDKDIVTLGVLFSTLNKNIFSGQYRLNYDCDKNLLNMTITDETLLHIIENYAYDWLKV